MQLQTVDTENFLKMEQMKITIYLVSKNALSAMVMYCNKSIMDDTSDDHTHRWAGPFFSFHMRSWVIWFPYNYL